MRPLTGTLLVGLLFAALAGLHGTVFRSTAREQAAANAAWEDRLKTERWREKVAPDFSGVTLDGERLRLAEVVGKRVLVLNFFATWCGPCKAETPELLRFWHERRERPFLLLGIAGNEARDKVEAYVAELGIDFPVLIDTEESAAKRYGVRAFPTTVVIGADGRVRLYETGAIFNADVALAGIADKELAELAQGSGITQEAFERAAAQERYGDVLARAEERPADAPRLEGRARAIAGAMDCPCGCADRVATCTCNTSQRIRAELGRGEFGERTDEEIITSLNQKYCVRAGA